MFSKNMGGIDRGLRVIVGLALIGSAVTGVLGPWAYIGVVPVFTASEPDWFAPWGNRERVVRQAVCPHHPCLGRCVMSTVICRDAVTFEMVAAKVREAMR